MERKLRKLSIVCFVVAALALLMHMSGLGLRLLMDLRHVYLTDVLADTSYLKGMDALICNLLKNSTLYGGIAMVMFLLAQLFIQISDVIYVKKWMEVTAETQITLLKENEKEVYGLIDRIVPVIALFVFAFILIGEWIKTNSFMQLAGLTRRVVMLPTLTLTVLGWAATFFASLVISLVFLWYFRNRMLNIYNVVKVDDLPA